MHVSTALQSTPPSSVIRCSASWLMTCGIRFPRSCCSASALKRHGPDPERRSLKPAEVIHRAATRMNRLIQDLLDVALMESGQLTIERARLSARELIVGAVDMQRPLAVFVLSRASSRRGPRCSRSLG